MASCQAERNTSKAEQQAATSNDRGKQPQGVRKRQPQLPSRKSARLEETQPRQERTVCIGRGTEPERPVVSQINKTRSRGLISNPSAPLKENDRKRKQAQESGERIVRVAKQKRTPRQPRKTSIISAFGDTSDQPKAAGFANNKTSSIDYWIENQKWPGRYFEKEYQTWKDFEKDSWLEENWEPENDMNRILARKKSSSSIRGKQSEASSTGSSDQRPRDIKSAPYQDARYETILATKGSFMGKSELGVTTASKSLCQTLLEAKQEFPNDSLFRDDIFEKTCETVRNKNEARVVRDISPLIAPSAEILAIRGAQHLEILIESVNEGWNNSIPITKTRPQPDYSVAFRREAFTDDQLQRIGPFVGELTETSFFMATYSMYFPFFTCETKCGAVALDVADRQNAHSMTMAVRAVVELFRLVKREKELHQQITAFSISHDYSSVRIYGHYPLIDGDKITFHRHPIHKFDFTAMEGKEKWTAYKFTKNLYDIWMPHHFRRICSVIDMLPSHVNFEVSQQSELESGLSQGLESRHLSDYSTQDIISLQEDVNDPSSHAPSRDVTPRTSVSEQVDERVSKRARKRGPPIELYQDGKAD